MNAAIAMFLVFYKFLQNLKAFDTFGYLVHMLFEVLIELIPFIVILTITTLAFGIAIIIDNGHEYVFAHKEAIIVDTIVATLSGELQSRVLVTVVLFAVI